MGIQEKILRICLTKFKEISNKPEILTIMAD